MKAIDKLHLKNVAVSGDYKDLINSPVVNVTGTAEQPIILYNLEKTALYIVDGYFKNISTEDSKQVNKELIYVIKNNDNSCICKFILTDTTVNIDTTGTTTSVESENPTDEEIEDYLHDLFGDTII